MSALVLAISTLCAAITLLYRQVLRERDRLQEHSDARLLEAWRREEEKDIRILTLEASNERLTQLAVDATEGWKILVTNERAKLP